MVGISLCLIKNDKEKEEFFLEKFVNPALFISLVLFLFLFFVCLEKKKRKREEKRKGNLRAPAPYSDEQGE